MHAELCTLIVYQKYMGSRIKTTVKANELSSVMTVCIRNFHNNVITCLLQIRERAIHRMFVARVVLMEVIFLCLNLKPDDGFLPYIMPDIFNKTRHGLTDIKLSELNLSKCCTQSFFGKNGTYI